MFKQNVENTADLRLYSAEIDYTLRMCATSWGGPWPSIIVFCRKDLFRKLHSLLTSSHIACQYYLPEPSRLKVFLDRLRSAPATGPSDLDIPRFKIYFWCSLQVPRTLYWGKLDDVVVERVIPDFRVTISQTEVWPGTWCGSQIAAKGGSRLATFACLLNVDSEFYGLTACHVFKEMENPSDLLLDNHSWNLPKASELGHLLSAWNETLGENAFVADEGIYDFSKASENESDLKMVTLKPQLNSKSLEGSGQTQAPKVHGTESMTSTVIFPSSELDGKLRSDLDWALIKVEEADVLANCIYYRGISFGHITQFAVRHPGEEREVLLINSSNDSYPRGTLLCGISLLGGLTRPGLVKVWSLMLSEGSCKLGLLRMRHGPLTTISQPYAKAIRGV